MNLTKYCLILCLATTVHAQTENDLLRSLGRAEGHLNRIWNERLTSADRENLRADERRWIAWKEGLPLEKAEQAVWARVDYLEKYAQNHGR